MAKGKLPPALAAYNAKRKAGASKSTAKKTTKKRTKKSRSKKSN